MSQQDLFREPLKRPPVAVAWGAGVDSTAMIIEMHRRGEPIDIVLHALTKWENALTDRYVEYFTQWMDQQGIPNARVQNYPKRIKPGVPMFDGLYEKCLAYSVLPGVALGYHTCAAWAKLTPQKNWYRSWETGQQAIREGTRIIQCVGFDAGPRDSVRYADREGYDDPMFEMRYPLREWKMDREACEQVIRNAGLDVPPKSSCTGCIATQPFELESFPTSEHARLVLLEARAAPRLRNCDGLWRKPIKGRNGATPRPGSMTEHIVTTGSLSQEVVTQIQQQAVPMLDRWCSGIGDEPVEHRPCIGEWLEMFDAAHSQMDQGGRYVRYQDQMSIPAKAA
ncbi:hypothetical protein [uncultured Salinicola sp.]|uniref:hypothetical protein n=1 Tax=uncultured Salinicola sp. TaxID=1193542 RepID=UPI002631E026|nr:hypothetical protein [uncultured Salinicola sp.]|tara:strand:+ start:3129 stop:4142 length:1014 start_codon:yes stop_codon:yes gene_type:complete